MPIVQQIMKTITYMESARYKPNVAIQNNGLTYQSCPNSSQAPYWAQWPVPGTFHSA